ncbi:autism susceptibility gene 2 protein-like, partial [Thrips palmi]|uniref:Autism susceptibility gene 2 protein-like n=1 Tax=Thrips palmi TaxID=161013 RepID=A0A6P8ZM95_THRPL
MESEVKQRSQRNRRRERAQRMQAQRESQEKGGGDSAEDESPSREKPQRPPPPNRRKRSKEPSFEEDVVDGFAILSFKNYEDIEVALKLSARNALSVKLALAPTLGDEKNHLKNGDVSEAAPAANNNNNHNNNNNQRNHNNHNHIRHSAASGNLDVGTSDDSGRASERLNGASVDTSHDRLSDGSSRCSSGRGYICDSEGEDDRVNEGRVGWSVPAARGVQMVSSSRRGHAVWRPSWGLAGTDPSSIYASPGGRKHDGAAASHAATSNGTASPPHQPGQQGPATSKHQPPATGPHYPPHSTQANRLPGHTTLLATTAASHQPHQPPTSIMSSRSSPRPPIPPYGMLAMTTAPSTPLSASKGLTSSAPSKGPASTPPAPSLGPAGYGLPHGYPHYPSLYSPYGMHYLPPVASSSPLASPRPDSLTVRSPHSSSLKTSAASSVIAANGQPLPSGPPVVTPGAAGQGSAAGHPGAHPGPHPGAHPGGHPGTHPASARASPLGMPLGSHLPHGHGAPPALGGSLPGVHLPPGGHHPGAHPAGHPGPATAATSAVPTSTAPAVTNASSSVITTSASSTHMHTVTTPLIGRSHSPRGHSPSRERDSYSSSGVSSMGRSSVTPVSNAGGPLLLSGPSGPQGPLPTNPSPFSAAAVAASATAASPSASSASTPVSSSLSYPKGPGAWPSSNSSSQLSPAGSSPAIRPGLATASPSASIASPHHAGPYSAGTLFAPPPPVTAAGPTPTSSNPAPFSAESLLSNQADLLRRELDSRFLASQDRSLNVGPPPYLRTEMHHHQHQHPQLHPGASALGALGAPPQAPSVFPPPLFKDVPKLGGIDSPFYRQNTLGLGSYPSYSGLPPLTALGNSTPFAPPSHLPTFTPKVADPSKPKSSKQGRWNAMHVRIAWVIYGHQQKSQADAPKLPAAAGQ